MDVRGIADARRGPCGRSIGPETVVGACLPEAPCCVVVVEREELLVLKVEVGVDATKTRDRVEWLHVTMCFLPLSSMSSQRHDW